MKKNYTKFLLPSGNVDGILDEMYILDKRMKDLKLTKTDLSFWF